jgi:hypothetical protein
MAQTGGVAKTWSGIQYQPVKHDFGVVLWSSYAQALRGYVGGMYPRRRAMAWGPVLNENASNEWRCSHVVGPRGRHARFGLGRLAA